LAGREGRHLPGDYVGLTKTARVDKYVRMN
jgi:hypothetical protein